MVCNNRRRKSRRLQRIFIVLACGFLSLALPGCSYLYAPLPDALGGGGSKDDVRISGRIKEGRYYSRYSNFSCAVPPLIHPGAVIEDDYYTQSGTVSFSDDLGALVRIDYWEIPKPLAVHAGTASGIKSIENWFFDSIVLGRMYRPFSSVLKIFYRGDVELVDAKTGQRDIALFAVVWLPKGSTISEDTTGRLDAMRPSILFVKGRYAYLIAIQDMSGSSGVGVNNQLLDRLEQLYQTCEFH